MKVGVGGSNFHHTVFKHEGSCVKVVYWISGKARMPHHKFRKHISVSLRFAEYLAVNAAPEFSHPAAGLR